MTTQQEWEKKATEYSMTANDFTPKGYSDFFYSLHKERLAEIREKVIQQSSFDVVPTDDILSLLTEETI